MRELHYLLSRNGAYIYSASYRSHWPHSSLSLKQLPKQPVRETANERPYCLDLRNVEQSDTRNWRARSTNQLSRTPTLPAHPVTRLFDTRTSSPRRRLPLGANQSTDPNLAVRGCGFTLQPRPGPATLARAPRCQYAPHCRGRPDCNETQENVWPEPRLCGHSVHPSWRSKRAPYRTRRGLRRHDSAGLQVRRRASQPQPHECASGKHIQASFCTIFRTTLD